MWKLGFDWRGQNRVPKRVGLAPYGPDLGVGKEEINLSLSWSALRHTASPLSPLKFFHK